MRQSDVASRKRKSTPASSASAPSKKPKRITGPPPRSRPFKRPYELSKDRPMSSYRGDANLLFLHPPPFIVLDKLPKLKGRPMADEPIAVNGFDAMKKHFYAAQAKWERTVEIMEEAGRRMVYYGRMLHQEAEASHKWVGQVGKLTWEGHPGRMKNYDAFKEALQKVHKMIKKAEKTVEEVKEPTKKWTVEFIAQRRAWDEEEEEADDAEDESFHDSNDDFSEEMEVMRSRCLMDAGH
ncbi:hypothetical protein QBC32DRAFT_6428 [Pseudoneurospora amorphoporcata]|uniref:Uncharacterized protein n=1 Tax=Pseudoneurospora amorphoporcata TaxID=241081 RepID=A0AAN6SE24_9PEZI|nr:hypothetical protein QBC32DRAFT_6428 [Pseudoneurospora amorphoporcata]